jgi:Co/Zn/Cd efflux system component
VQELSRAVRWAAAQQFESRGVKSRLNALTHSQGLSLTVTTALESMFSPSKERRIATVIVISSAFFLVELIIGFRNHSLALVADAFHVASDLIGFVVALVAIYKRKSTSAAPNGFSFGWQRAELLGGFFNGGMPDFCSCIYRILADSLQFSYWPWVYLSSSRQ